MGMARIEVAGAGPVPTTAGAPPGGTRGLGVGAEPRGRLSWGGELVTVLLGAWIMIGLFVDGWAHSNLAALETFFTPWHALFYSGFIACAAWILWQVDRRYRAGSRGLDAVPAGFGLALAGLGIFALGGAGDLVWHTIFGIETNIDALFSPTHLLLFVGIVLVTSAPLRAAWADPAEPAAPGFVRFLPVLLSATLTATVVAFMFMFLGAFIEGAGDLDDVIGASYQGGDVTYLTTVEGVSSVLATNLIVLAPLLLLIRRWRVPFGTATVLLGTVATLTSAIQEFRQWWLVAAALVAGLAVDVLLTRLQPWRDRRRFWAAGGLIPIVVWTVYFGTIAAVQTIGWVAELWTGSILWAGLLGTALAVLAWPPAMPASAASAEAPRATDAAGAGPPA
jgi:hypothetical protein